MMKKKILKLVLLAVVTICTTIGIKSIHKENESPLSLIFANVEVLASSSKGGDNYKLCYSTLKSKKGYTYYEPLYRSPGLLLFAAVQERTGSME